MLPPLPLLLLLGTANALLTPETVDTEPETTLGVAGPLAAAAAAAGVSAAARVLLR